MGTKNLDSKKRNPKIVDYRDEFGMRHRIKFQTKAEADEFRLHEKIRIQRVKRGMPAMKRMQFSDYKKIWLERFRIKAEARGKLNTYQDYVSIFENHLDKLMQNYFLSDLKPAIVRDVTMALLTSKTNNNTLLSSKTVRNILTPFHTLLSDAFIDELTDRDLSVFIDKPTGKSDKRIYPLLRSEVDLFLQTVEERYRLFFAISFWTGARTGEVLALKFEDFDHARHQIHIQRSLSRGVLTSPKSGKPRVIDIVPELRGYFINWKHLKSSYLFCTETGHPLDRNNMRNRVWASTLKKIGLAYRSLYHTRHTFASYTMARGDDPLWIANMMGDTVETVWRHYAVYRDKTQSLLKSAIN